MTAVPQQVPAQRIWTTSFPLENGTEFTAFDQLHIVLCTLHTPLNILAYDDYSYASYINVEITLIAQ